MEKIVFVIEQLYGGGAERVTAALMNELCKDTEVHLISTYCYDTTQEYPTDARIVHHNFAETAKTRAGLLLKRILFLRRTIREIDPMCVVSLAGCGTNALLMLALLGKKTPQVLSERNDPARFPASKIERGLRLLSYRMCDGLVFQTHEAQSYFSERIRSKSTIICNPLTGNLPPRYEGVRERKIVNCCRLNQQKNLDLLIDAFSDIADEFPDVVLEINGEGPERQRLEQKTRDMGLAGKIFMPGYADNVFDKMLKASMFVSSSDYEGISNSMLEAIALGVPTVCTDCPAGSAREVIRDGENGLLVPVNDRKALAEAMRRLLAEPDLQERLSQNGCRLREDISVGKIADKWHAYIRRICGKDA